MDATEITGLTAAALGRALAARRTDPIAVTEAFLDRIGRTDVPVFISVSADRARAEAEASARRHARGEAAGPLDGVPVGWKDLADVAGSVTTAGSALLRDTPPAESDAPAVANLAAAGMVCLGKLNLTEFAYSGIGLNPHFGTPPLPHGTGPARVPGGSSSGCAVGVAMGLMPCAIGTDTGGSVRVPAAFNGIVGFKTTERRIDKRGVVPLAETFDTLGPLARGVEDCALLWDALRGRPPALPEAAAASSIRLVVPDSPLVSEVDEAVGAAFEAALDRLSRAGVVIERRLVGVLDATNQIHVRQGRLAAAEAYFVHRDRVEGPEAERMDRRVLARIRAGREIPGYELVGILQARGPLVAGLAEALDGAFLAMPTVPHTAPEIAPLEADDAVFHATNLRTLRNTIPGNFLGTCGLTLRSGQDEAGLPTGLLVSAAGGNDERLLSAGLTLERLLDGA